MIPLRLKYTCININNHVYLLSLIKACFLSNNLILFLQCLSDFFLPAFETTLLISAYLYFCIVFTCLVVSVTYNASIQYVTWNLISSLLYIHCIRLPCPALYIRWVRCCNVQNFVAYNWNRICFCSDYSATEIVRPDTGYSNTFFFQHNRIFVMGQIRL
jgi:hypothetical protein